MDNIKNQCIMVGYTCYSQFIKLYDWGNKKKILRDQENHINGTKKYLEGTRKYLEGTTSVLFLACPKWASVISENIESKRLDFLQVQISFI